MKPVIDKPWYQFVVEFLSANFYALAGALLSLFVTQKVGFWKGLVSFFVGFLVAVITPGIIADFRPIGDSTRQGVAFLAGMTGMNLTLGLIRLTIQFRNDPQSLGADFLNIFRGKYDSKIHSTKINDKLDGLDKAKEPDKDQGGE